MNCLDYCSLGKWVGKITCIGGKSSQPGWLEGVFPGPDVTKKGSLYVSGNLPTYASPKPTFCWSQKTIGHHTDVWPPTKHFYGFVTGSCPTNACWAGKCDKPLRASVQEARRCVLSQLNSGQNFLTWRASQFPLSHSPNSWMIMAGKNWESTSRLKNFSKNYFWPIIMEIFLFLLSFQGLWVVSKSWWNIQGNRYRPVSEEKKKIMLRY